MSIQLNHTDFQCLQDQLVDLKTKNYELAEKNRRGQADFEAAKAKICSLQVKLEEQERDFQLTSTTLRREIELAYSNTRPDTSAGNNNGDADDADGGDHKSKYKKLLHKAKELQQRYEKSVEVVKQMDEQIAALASKSVLLEKDNSQLKQTLEEQQSIIASSKEELQNNLSSAIEEYKKSATHDCQEHIDNLNAIKLERDNLQDEISKLRDEVKQYQAKFDCQIEERKIQDRKGSQMIKELKRQLALEKNRNETIQKRLESLLSQPNTTVPPAETNQSFLENRIHLSTSSSTTNGNSRGSRGPAIGQQRDDSNSVSSWSLVPGKTTSTSSMCSMDSEDRETVHLPSNDVECDISSQHPAINSHRQDLSMIANCNPSSTTSPNKHTKSSSSSLSQVSMNESGDSNIYVANNKKANSTQLNYSTATESSPPGLKFEDQAALIERVTRLQHDKWTLEEKLSYMEQANAALAQDLADKSHIIRHYFMDQAVRSVASNHHNARHDPSVARDLASRRVSFPNNINQLLADKPSLKKMVDFLKERSQVTASESGSISREATKKMQVMLEETLIKCLKLQENLDFVTSELNKLQT